MDKREHDAMTDLAGLMVNQTPPVTRREHLEGRARLIASVEKMRRPHGRRLYAMATALAIATIAVVATATAKNWGPWNRGNPEPPPAIPTLTAPAPPPPPVEGRGTGDTNRTDTNAIDTNGADTNRTDTNRTDTSTDPETSANRRAPVSTRVATAAERATWRELVSRGEFKRVVREANALGFDTVLRTRNLSDLRALGDSARYLGGEEAARAHHVYEAIRRRFPGGDEAHTAAFVLGRLSEEQANQPDAAIAWYTTYLREGSKGPFAGDALGRKMVLVARRSGRREARALAMEYLELYPHGPYEKPALDLTR